MWYTIFGEAHTAVVRLAMAFENCLRLHHARFNGDLPRALLTCHSLLRFFPTTNPNPTDEITFW